MLNSSFACISFNIFSEHRWNLSHTGAQSKEDYNWTQSLVKPLKNLASLLQKLRLYKSSSLNLCIYQNHICILIVDCLVCYKHSHKIFTLRMHTQSGADQCELRCKSIKIKTPCTTLLQYTMLYSPNITPVLPSQVVISDLHVNTWISE